MLCTFWIWMVESSYWRIKDPGQRIFILIEMQWVININFQIHFYLFKFKNITNAAVEYLLSFTIFFCLGTLPTFVNYFIISLFKHYYHLLSLSFPLFSPPRNPSPLSHIPFLIILLYRIHMPLLIFHQPPFPLLLCFLYYRPLPPYSFFPYPFPAYMLFPIPHCSQTLQHHH